MTLGGCDAESGSEHREDVRRGGDEWSDELSQGWYHGKCLAVVVRCDKSE